ncbi:MAG: hypothetical protein JXR37_35010 [Kiritimatiellae bacterium]|nr:hypothetical protein [Kiritimatiellia bacterium]
MRRLTVILAVVGAVLCGGCGDSSQRTLFETACKAVRAHADFPANAVLGSMREAEIYRGKNAACILVPYAVGAETGAAGKATYTVWLKRVTLRQWEVDRCEPTPVHR